MEVDKHGNEIKEGDTLFNPHDSDKYHTVIQDAGGNLFLGDYDSPLERYAPHRWWEIVPNARREFPAASAGKLDGVVGNSGSGE